MSTLYFIALCGFCVVMFGILLEAVVGVSRKPVWHSQHSRVALDCLHTAQLVEQEQPAAGHAGLIVALPMLPVPERHSRFAGRINNEDFQATA